MTDPLSSIRPLPSPDANAGLQEQTFQSHLRAAWTERSELTSINQTSPLSSGFPVNTTPSIQAGANASLLDPLRTYAGSMMEYQKQADEVYGRTRQWYRDNLGLDPKPTGSGASVATYDERQGGMLPTASPDGSATGMTLPEISAKRKKIDEYMSQALAREKDPVKRALILDQASSMRAELNDHMVNNTQTQAFALGEFAVSFHQANILFDKAKFVVTKLGETLRMLTQGG